MPGPRVTRRYPFAPLAEAMGMTEHAACRTLGIAGSTQQEYRTRGMSELVADRMAAKAGLAAYTVWPEMLDHAIEVASKACDFCGRSFVPKCSIQRFCPRSVRPCYERWWARDNAERRGERYEANRERELSRASARYWADPESARAKRRERYARNAEAEKAKARARRAAAKERAA